MLFVVSYFFFFSYVSSICLVVVTCKTWYNIVFSSLFTTFFYHEQNYIRIACFSWCSTFSSQVFVTRFWPEQSAAWPLTFERWFWMVKKIDKHVATHRLNDVFSLKLIHEVKSLASFSRITFVDPGQKREEDDARHTYTDSLISMGSKLRDLIINNTAAHESPWLSCSMIFFAETQCFDTNTRNRRTWNYMMARKTLGRRLLFSLPAIISWLHPHTSSFSLVVWRLILWFTVCWSWIFNSHMPCSRSKRERRVCNWKHAAPILFQWVDCSLCCVDPLSSLFSQRVNYLICSFSPQ